MSPPEELHWLFWDVDPKRLDLDLHASYILPRVLERGRLLDVQWLIRSYGLDAIHTFLREAAQPELSARTIAFWRAFFRSEAPWRIPPDWRRTSSVPFCD